MDYITILIERLRKLYSNNYSYIAAYKISEDFEEFIFVEEYEKSGCLFKIFRDTQESKYIMFYRDTVSNYSSYWNDPIEVIPKEVTKIEYEEVSNRE